MKYLNKKKKYRLAEWYTAPPPSRVLVPQAKKWCQQNISKGHFYFHYTNTKWWFEDSQDAVAFTLVWSGKVI